jgi:putative endonuclease
MHAVYIMASRPNGAIHVGRTGNLPARVLHHKAGRSEHTARYKIDRLVWYELHDEFDRSLRRERALKRWRRAWKDALIAERNPHWIDLMPTDGTPLR